MKSSVRDTAEENVRSMAAKDPAFRKELTSNPTGALEKLFGGKLPGNVKVHVHQESPTDIHLVLPAQGSAKQESGGAQPHAYCSHPGGGSWSSCGYELTCYGPTCNSN
jgi:hypothetical protein